MEVGNKFDDPFRPLDSVEPISDSIMDDILSEEGEGFLADIEMVGLLQ